jgi:hypothetical protein
MTDSRGQSHIIGIVLLVGLTTIALGGLTTVVGEIVDEQTATADETRVAHALENGLRPVEQTGPGETRVAFSSGQFETVERQLRIRTSSGTQRRLEIGGLVYTSGASRVGFVGGAVVRGQPDNAWLVREPPVTVTRDNETLIVGAVQVGENGTTISGSDGVGLRLRTNVTHRHEQLSESAYRIGIETETPEPLVRAFQRRELDTSVNDIDGDGVPSVVAHVKGRQTIELVTHRMHTEVTDG